MDNAKKKKKGGKTIEWENLEIFSRNLEIPKKYVMQRWAQKRDKNGKPLTEAEEVKRKWQEYIEGLYKKKVLMTGIITMLGSLT